MADSNPENLRPPEKAKRPRPAMRRAEIRHAFQVQTSVHQRMKHEAATHGAGLQRLWLGIAVAQQEDGKVDIGFAAHDGTYSIDFATHVIDVNNTISESKPPSRRQTPAGSQAATPSRPGTPLNPENRATALATYLIERVQKYQEEHLYKFVGAGLTEKVLKMSPHLPSRLWQELDIVPIVFDNAAKNPYPRKNRHSQILVDEEADSMARRCVLQFGPTYQPHLLVGFTNEVEVDCGGRALLTHLDDYPKSVGQRTWTATTEFAESLKNNQIKIAFFNSTPQGGGVALMRHALIRFFRLLGVDVRWYVPKPKPEVFRITKNNHNILQGVAEPSLRTTDEQFEILDEWAETNADRYWTTEDGPLAPISEGGAHVVIVDDPQMPSLVRIAKELDPNRAVVFRSHIQVRADLADQKGSPTSEVWNWLWENVKNCDVFISHPVREFVPSNVDFNKVGYMPATTDWFDGLNKHLSEWDNQYYMYQFDRLDPASREGLPAFPERQYIVQIARFDPAKGIPDVLASYAEFRREYLKDTAPKDTPQLIIAGHGAIDDPDAAGIWDQTMELLKTKYADIKDDVIVARVPPTDQLLNVLMSNAHVALQLSTREGFEVKVSEAVHKGVPVIATKAGGIPLQVEDGKSGYVVEPGDYKAVAKHLHHLFTDDEAYKKMSNYAADHVSDEVSTVGNALCWLYLADELSQGHKVEPDSKWINDMARDKANLPYEEGETRLPRVKKLDLKSS